MAAAEPRIAIFDLDRTVTRQGTYTPFLLHCAQALGKSRLAVVAAALPAVAGYGLGFRSRGELKARMLECAIAGRPRAEVMAWAGGFGSVTEIRPGARAAIARHRAAGDRLVLATASFDFYAQVFAEALGFDDLIATGSVWRDEVLAPAIAGENCYGPAKLAAVRAYVERMNPRPRVVAYSDHHSDFALLRWADEGVAVNPSSRLRSLARAHALTISDWDAI
ncbi:MAG: HAD family hydrolase [Rhodospirillaceae bacterium]